MLYIILDLFGGPTSQLVGAINVDIIATEVYKLKLKLYLLLTKALMKLCKWAASCFLSEAARVLKVGGRLYINFSKGNAFGKLPDAQILKQLELAIIQLSGPLEPQFLNYRFRRTSPRPDGTVDIPINSIKTTILEKI